MSNNPTWAEAHTIQQEFQNLPHRSLDNIIEPSSSINSTSDRPSRGHRRDNSPCRLGRDSHHSAQHQRLESTALPKLCSHTPPRLHSTSTIFLLGKQLSNISSKLEFGFCKLPRPATILLSFHSDLQIYIPARSSLANIPPKHNSTVFIPPCLSGLDPSHRQTTSCHQNSSINEKGSGRTALLWTVYCSWGTHFAIFSQYVTLLFLRAVSCFISRCLRLYYHSFLGVSSPATQKGNGKSWISGWEKNRVCFLHIDLLFCLGFVTLIHLFLVAAVPSSRTCRLAILCRIA